jgi:hypothetical protein
VAAAKNAGGSDNITVVMVSCWLSRVCGKKFLVGKWEVGKWGSGGISTKTLTP